MSDANRGSGRSTRQTLALSLTALTSAGKPIKVLDHSENRMSNKALLMSIKATLENLGVECSANYAEQTITVSPIKV